MGQHEEDFSYDPAVQNQIYCIIQNDMLHLKIIYEVIPVFTFFLFHRVEFGGKPGYMDVSNDYKMFWVGRAKSMFFFKCNTKLDSYHCNIIWHRLYR